MPASIPQSLRPAIPSDRIAQRHETASMLTPRDRAERHKILCAFDCGVAAAAEPDEGHVFQIEIKAVGMRRCDAIAHATRVLASIIQSPGAGGWAVGGTDGNATAHLTLLPK